VWYWVAVPSRYQGLLLLSLSSTAPVTTVPGTAVVAVEPVLTSLVGKVSGWPSLSVRFRLNHHEKPPSRLPSEALACWPVLVTLVPYSVNGWVK